MDSLLIPLTGLAWGVAVGLIGPLFATHRNVSFVLSLFVAGVGALLLSKTLAALL